MGVKGREFSEGKSRAMAQGMTALVAAGGGNGPPKESGGDGFEVEFFEVGGADGRA